VIQRVLLFIRFFASLSTGVGKKITINKVIENTHLGIILKKSFDIFVQMVQYKFINPSPTGGDY
ncbi:MAG: hypothetical protein RSC97_11360, partial [Eubacterium sp.]